jgi:hypothetical protein
MSLGSGMETGRFGIQVTDLGHAQRVCSIPEGRIGVESSPLRLVHTRMNIILISVRMLSERVIMFERYYLDAIHTPVRVRWLQGKSLS